MIPETREQLEKSNSAETYEDCVQALESYLRQEISPDVINNATFTVLENLKTRLEQKAEDWSMKNKVEFGEDTCKSAAVDAISRYIVNWKNKKQGDDNRACRFGKSAWLRE